MQLDPKAMSAAREAWTASDVSTRFFSDVEHCALEAAISAYLSSAIPGEVAELAGDLHSFADRLAHVRNPTDMLTVRSAATALTSLAARVEALEAGLEAAAQTMRNSRGAIESNQIGDKDVWRQLTRGIDAARALLTGERKG